VIKVEPAKEGSATPIGWLGIEQAIVRRPRTGRSSEGDGPSLESDVRSGDLTSGNKAASARPSPTVRHRDCSANRSRWRSVGEREQVVSRPARFTFGSEEAHSAQAKGNCR